MTRKSLVSLHRLLSLIVILSLIIPSGAVAAETPAPTPTPTETPTAEPSATATETAVATETATPTETASPTSEASATPTESATAAPTTEPTATIATVQPTPTLDPNSPNQPRLSSALKELANAYASGGPVSAAALAQAMGLSLQQSNENVQVVTQLAPGQTVDNARQTLSSLGGVIEAEEFGLIQVSLPLRNLRAMAANGTFAGVRLPARPVEAAGLYSSEGVSRSNANEWHDQGIIGQGVVVAIIDTGFLSYTAFYGTDLPPATLLTAKSFRADLTMGVSNHGTQVAQTIYDMAPGVQLILVAVSTDVEFVEALNWLSTQKVDVVNSSIGWLNYDDGDGDSTTGGQNPLVDAVNKLYNFGPDQNIGTPGDGPLFVTAAGNQAFGHWEGGQNSAFVVIPSSNLNGVFQDWDTDPTVDIFNDIVGWPSSGACRQVDAYLSWNDWTNPPAGADFNLKIMRFANGVWTAVASSSNDQAGGYPWPTEFVTSACVAAGGKVAIVVEDVANTLNNYLEVYSNWPLQYSKTDSSLVSPADAPGALTVGAYNWLNKASLEPVSSQGPVNNGGGAAPGGGEANKPDLTGPDCTTTSFISGSAGTGFCGTSSAAAHVAGAAALYKQVNPNDSAADIRLKILGDAENAGPAADPDPQWGDGTLFLKSSSIQAPPSCNPNTAICVGTNPWPLFQHAPTRTGSSVSAIQISSQLLWSALLGGDPPLSADVRSVVVGPAITHTDPAFPTYPRGLAYVRAGRYVYGINPDLGTVVWRFDTGLLGAGLGQGAPAATDYSNNGSPTDATDDALFVWVGTGDGYVYKLDGINGDADDSPSTPGLQAVCKSLKLGADFSKSSPIIGADGTLYLLDDAVFDRLVAVNSQTCAQKWAVTLGLGPGTSSPMYWDKGTGNLSDDRIIVGANKLYAVTVWGGIEWSLSLFTAPELAVTASVPTTAVVVNRNPVIPPPSDWEIYAVNNFGDLYRITTPDQPSASASRVVDAPAGGHGLGSPAVFDSGGGNYYLYWGHVSTLYRYNTATASMDSTAALYVLFNLTDATPVVDNDGDVFFGSSYGGVFGVDGNAAGTMPFLAGWGTSSLTVPQKQTTAGLSTAMGMAIANDGAPTNGWLLASSLDDQLRLYGPVQPGCATCGLEPASDWPSFQNEQRNTGASTSFAMTIPAAAPWLPLWARTSPNLVSPTIPAGDVFAPVVGADTLDYPVGSPVEYPRGLAYYVSGRYLQALDLNTRTVLNTGAGGWPYDLGALGQPLGFAAPAVANDTTSAPGFAQGLVYIGGRDGVLHAVNAATGARVWAVDLGLYDISKASPIIGADGTVYVVEDGPTDNLIAITHQGAVRWRRAMGIALGASHPAFDSVNLRVFVGGDKLYCFDQSGAACSGWATNGVALGAGTSVPSAPVIVGGSVFAFNNLGDLYNVTISNGAVALAYDAPALAGFGSLALDSNTLYWALGGRLYRHNIGGSTEVFGLTGATTNSTPTADSAGGVFVGTSSGLFYVPQSLAGTLAPSGSATAPTVNRTPVFTSPLLGSMAGSGAIIDNVGTASPTTDGLLLWPSADDNLYAFGAIEGCTTCVLDTGQWPTSQKSATNFFDPATNAFTGGSVNLRPTMLFNAPLGISYTRAPVIDSSTPTPRMFFVAGTALYARFTTSDTPVWTTSTGAERTYSLGFFPTIGSFGMPALGKDTSRPADDQIIIYVGGSDGNLHAVLAKTGSLLWKVDVGYDISKAPITIADNGFVLVVEDTPGLTDQLIAVDPKGSIAWKAAIGNSTGTSSPAIDVRSGGVADDVVVVGGGSGLYAFDLLTGATETGFPVTAAGAIALGAINSSPVVAQWDGGASSAYIAVTSTFGDLITVPITGGTATIVHATTGIGRAGSPLVIRDNGGANIRVFFGLGTTLYRTVLDVPTAAADTDSLVLGGDLSDSTPLPGDTVSGNYQAVYVGSTDAKLYVVTGIQTSTAGADLTKGYETTSVIYSLAGYGAYLDINRLIWPSQDGKLRVFESGTPGGVITISGQWSMFQNNGQHTGAASVSLPTPSTAIEQWAFLGSGGLGDARSPVLGQVGIPAGYAKGVMFYTAGSSLYAVDASTGLEIKRWDLGLNAILGGYAAPAVTTTIDSEPQVMVADSNGVVRSFKGLTSNNPVWSVDVGFSASTSSPVIGRNGLVYVVETALNRLHAINLSNGAIRWTATLGPLAGNSTPAYWNGATDQVYVGADKLYAFNASTGAPITGSPCTLSGTVNSAPLVNSLSNTVYALTSTGKLYEIPAVSGSIACPGAPDGSVTGVVSITGGSMAMNNAATALYFGAGQVLYRYDIGGNTFTQVTLTPPSPAVGYVLNFTNSTPLVDNAGNVFIGGADGWLYGLNGTLTALTPSWSAFNGAGWPKRIGSGNTLSGAVGALAMDSDGNLYVPSIDDFLRRFGPPPAACGANCRLYTEAPWPTFQHDVTHSGKNSVGFGHRTPVTKWSATLTNLNLPQTPRTPTLGPATTFYPGGLLFYTAGAFVIARDAVDGSLKWQYSLGALGGPSILSGASPALMLRNNGGDGCSDPVSCGNDTVWVIVGGANGFLYALDANPLVSQGKLVWRIDLGGDISKSSPVVGSDGTIYVLEDSIGADTLHAVYWNGARKWSRLLDSVSGSGASTPTLDSGTATTRIFVASGTKVYAFDTSGNPAAGWPGIPANIGGKTLPSGLVNTTLVFKNNGASTIGAEDDLWALNTSGWLYRLDPTNSNVQDGNAPTTPTIIDPIVTGLGLVSDGVAPAIQDDPLTGDTDIISMTTGTRFYRLRWDNASKVLAGTPYYWTFIYTLGNTSPVIDNNGWSYVLDSGGFLRAFFRYAPPFVLGQPPFITVFSKKVATQGAQTGGIIVGNEGRLYLPSRNGTFYVLGAP